MKGGDEYKVPFCQMNIQSYLSTMGSSEDRASVITDM